MDKTLELVVIALLGALCSILANKGIAVFNDGLRPILPEYLEKKIGKKELAATSFALSFGLVIGFANPTFPSGAQEPMISVISKIL